MRIKITASIVIYKNDPGMVMEAARSFLDSVPDSALFLVDNSPTDSCRNYFTDPRIHYIFNNKNLGFGAGHNVALRKVLQENLSTYHIILNPDVYFSADVPSRIHSFMEENEQVGLVMPKVLFPDGRLQPLCKMLPSPFILFTRRFLQFIPFWIDRLNHWYEMHFSGYDKIMDVPFLSGCFMFLRVDALRRVGLFDEQIFLYTEDTDLTRRIHKYYRTIFFPEVTIYHYNQRGSYKSLVILMHHIFSAIKYFNKWGWFVDAERENVNQRILLKFTE